MGSFIVVLWEGHCIPEATMHMKRKYDQYEYDIRRENKGKAAKAKGCGVRCSWWWLGELSDVEEHQNKGRMSLWSTRSGITFDTRIQTTRSNFDSHHSPALWSIDRSASRQFVLRHGLLQNAAVGAHLFCRLGFRRRPPRGCYLRRKIRQPARR